MSFAEGNNRVTAESRVDITGGVCFNLRLRHIESVYGCVRVVRIRACVYTHVTLRAKST